MSVDPTPSETRTAPIPLINRGVERNARTRTLTLSGVGGSGDTLY